MFNKAEKTLAKIGFAIRDMILCSDCETVCWYFSSDFKKVVSKELQKEILDQLLSSVEDNTLNLDKKYNLPVLYLSEPIEVNKSIVNKLYLQNIVTADLIDKYRNETDLKKNDIRFLSFLFNCSEDIILKLNNKDYETACNLLNLLYIV